MKPILLLILGGFFSLANAQDTTPTSTAPAVNADAGNILNNVLSKYKSMQTYSSSGAVVTDMQVNGTQMQTTTTFSIKLKKPNLYLINWSQTASTPGVPIQAGAVWSDGTQPYLYMGVLNAYSKMGDDMTALGGATGISGGAAYTIPALFLSAFMDKGSPFSRLKNPVIEKIEPVGGEDCYVISGATNYSAKETYWISKSSRLILKHERSLAPPPGGIQLPDMSDADLEKALRATGQPVTDESKKRMRDMMQTARNTLKNSNLNGITTETQADIANPDLTANDFQFTPPSGAILKDSILGPQTEFTQPVKNPSGSSSSYETVQAPVEQVFSTADGDNKFVAYLAKWKGTDVIVSDPLARSGYKVGDTIQFTASKINGAGFSTLSFTLAH